MVGEVDVFLFILPFTNIIPLYLHCPVKTEIAQNFKEQGNEYFKGKRYREAIGFYKQAIDGKPEDKTLLEALLCNTAACNLELSTPSRS